MHTGTPRLDQTMDDFVWKFAVYLYILQINIYIYLYSLHIVYTIGIKELTLLYIYPQTFFSEP